MFNPNRVNIRELTIEEPEKPSEPIEMLNKLKWREKFTLLNNFKS